MAVPSIVVGQEKKENEGHTETHTHTHRHTKSHKGVIV